jgi:ribosomal protein S18 acetylase RimI-like enzyme
MRPARVSEREALEELQRRSSMHQPMYRARLAAHPDATRIARERGATRIDVVANPQAVAFYEAVGFRPAGEAQTRFGPASRMSLTMAG